MSSSDFGSGKKQTVYSGPAPTPRGTNNIPAPKSQYGTVYDGPTQQPDGGTGFSGAAPGGTVFGGPAPAGTVYSPSRQSQPNAGLPQVAAPDKVKKTGNIFFLIAALSVVNTILAFSGARMAIGLGLGITRVDVAAHQGNGIAPVLLLNLVAPMVLVIIGIFARQGSSAAFLIGMLLYAGDTVFLWVDGMALHVPSLIVHGIFLVSMFGGYRMTRE